MGENKLDKISLILRRIIIILTLLLIVYLILFRRIGIGKKSNSKGDTVNNAENNEVSEESISTSGGSLDKPMKMQKLGSKYMTDGTSIFYEGEELKFVNAEDFVVLDKNQKKEIGGMLINSDNLLSIFQDYDTRVAMMNTIDDIIANKKNVTEILKTSSENGMNKIKSDYEDLSQYNRKNQKGVLTPEQRAKFAVVYLYIKIAKNAKGTVYMEQALSELKYFLENFDSDNLKPEITDQNFKLKGNVGMDKNCIFIDGKLYTCLLDNLF